MKLKVIPSSLYHDEFTIIDEGDGQTIADVPHLAQAYEIVAALEVVEHVPVLLSALVHLMVEIDFDDEVIDAMHTIHVIVEELAKEVNH